MTTSEFFDERAAVYDELRPQDGAWWRRFEALVREGDLRGRRVLDVGCGTGTLAAALAERAHARVWGVEPSGEMLAVARSRAPRGVGLKQGSARGAAVQGRLVRAGRDVARRASRRPPASLRRGCGACSSPEGRLAIATFDQAHFDAWWAVRFFPSLRAVDRARFPSRDELATRAREAGFTDVRHVPLPDIETISRETALRRLHGRHISTFALLDPDEVRERDRARRAASFPIRSRSVSSSCS